MVRGSPAQVRQRGAEEGTVQEGAVVLDDFNQLVLRSQHPRRHVCREHSGSHIYQFTSYNVKGFDVLATFYVS